MEEDLDYDDAHTLRAPRRSRWYTRLWPSCLGGGCACRKRPRKFTLYSIGYDPVGEIQWAASVGDVASVERLINYQRQYVNAHDVKLRTSLHYACAHNHPDVVKLLLSKEAYMNVQDDEGCTPLMKAVQRDNIRCATILLIQGANPHLRDLSGNTALHHAVSRDNTTMVTILLHFEADIEAETEYGLTPYQLALFEGKRQMAWVLAQNGASTDSAFQSYSERTPSERAKPKKKKHVKFNKVVHYSTDPKPFCSGAKPSKPLKSILKTSAPFCTASGTVKQRTPLWLYETPDVPEPGPEDENTPSITVNTEKQLLEDSDIETSKEPKAEINLSSPEECDFTRDLFEEQDGGGQRQLGGGQGGRGKGGGGGERERELEQEQIQQEEQQEQQQEQQEQQQEQQPEQQQEEQEEQEAEFVIHSSENALSEFQSYRLHETPDVPEPGTEDENTPSITMKTEKKLSDGSNICTLKKSKTEMNLYSLEEPSEHVKPMSTYGDDRVDAVDQKTNADSTQSTAVDSTITLEDIPMLLIMSIVWLLMFLLLLMVTVQHLINEMSQIASSNQINDQVAAEAEH